MATRHSRDVVVIGATLSVSERYWDVLFVKHENRLRVQNQWFWSYFTGQRGSRLIPEKPRVLRNQ
jgi:hypothetical protein